MEKAQIFHNGEQVWSVGHIDGNTFFGPFRGDAKKMVARILDSQESSHQLKTSNKATDISLETDEQIWLAIVPGALCKWDPTMEMIRGPDNEIYLRTTRDILPREELRAWFSPSLERELGISRHDVDIKAKGNPYHCPTCEMINLKINGHSLYKNDYKVKADDHEKRFENTSTNSPQSSSSTDKSYKNSSQIQFLGFESCIDHSELKSAFRRFTDKNFPPFENPKLASLISSFAHPRQLKNASSESLADYHKKEFRKKFQGNEHYLRKHLYREGLDKCSLVRYTEEERDYIASVSIQRPAIKYEKFQPSYCDNDDVNKSRFFYRENSPCTDENSSDYRPERHRIWNPFCSYSGDDESKPKICEEGRSDQTMPDTERSSDVTQDNGHERTDTKSLNDNCHGEQESKTSVNNYEEETYDCSRPNDDPEEMVKEAHNIEQIKEIQSKDLETDYKKNPERLDFHEDHSPSQSSLVSRYYYTTPWQFPNAMLSSLSMKDMSHRAATFASFSRYQNLQPFTLPYGVPLTGAQTRPRVTQGFTCDFCGKVYCRKYVLKIHMRTHTGFKPLKCKFCDKSFSDPSNMKKHVKLHETENTVHKCKHCGRNFVRYRGLLNHIKSKHTQPLNMGILI